MNRSFLGRAALTLALIAGVAGSALSSDAGGDPGAAYDQVPDHFEITALLFEPTHPDGMSAVISDMGLTPLEDSAGGQYVLDTAGRENILNELQKRGVVRRQLHQREPLGDDGKASAFSVWPGREFSASMKVRYIPSVRQVPDTFAMNYSLRAGLKPRCTFTRCDSELLRYASGGSVLLPGKGALMTFRETENGFLIWLISAN